MTVTDLSQRRTPPVSRQSNGRTSASAIKRLRGEEITGAANPPRARTLRVAVIGCGSIGRRHLANLRHITAECPADIFVYDVSDTSCQNAAQTFDACAVRHAGELWAARPGHRRNLHSLPPAHILRSGRGACGRERVH